MANILVIRQSKTGTGYYEEHLFLTHEDVTGKDYYLDGYRVDKEYGNGLYKRLIKCPDYYKVDVIPVTEDLRDELIEKYRKNIDEYADYIDNGRQWKAAVEKNERMYNCIRALNLCIKGE